MQQQTTLDYTATLADPAPATPRTPLSRAKLLGLAVSLAMTVAWFGTVVWLGNDLAADMKAGTRTISPGMMVPDSEG